jgi:hypothetical protein
MATIDRAVASLTVEILTLAADGLDQRAAFTHPVGGYQAPRCASIGTVRAAIATASDTLLRRNRLVGCSRIDAARITVYLMLPPVTGTVAEYANRLRALAA